MRRLVTAAMGLLASGAAAAYQPSFDPRAHRDFAGPPSTVLVLGTPHLSGLPKDFRPETLAPVLDRLAAWRPDIVTIEGVSGPECEYLRTYAAIIPDVAKDYCWNPAPAAKATGLTVAAATIEATRLLEAWPKEPTPAQRRHLAAMFLAGGDRTSALVQWLRLPGAERIAADGLDAGLVSLLQEAPAKRNENYMIAAAVAARVGLERVYPADDHSADEPVARLPDAYGEALAEIWKPAAARLAAQNVVEANLTTPARTLAMYRYFNTAEMPRIAFDSDYGAALKHAAPPLYGRQYVGWWEVRNLRMVANIRASFMTKPGARVLAIVGASHRGYFEAYLGLMHDVVLADPGEVLR